MFYLYIGEPKLFYIFYKPLRAMKQESREEEINDFWERNRVFEKSVDSRPKNKQYVFYDGPPFATGLPHYGHILGLTSKDLFPRFWTMKGYRVERRWGWDCHGLPIENIAEEELGIKEKKQVFELGVDKYNEFCRSKVLFYAKEWKKTVRRMGKWIDFDNAYKTMDNDYMESVWHIFKKLYDEKYIYEGKKVLMYCPRCETPLANAEIAMDNSYKDVTEKSATVKFKLKGENTCVLAWTTTPWTLIGNVALAVNPKHDYVEVSVKGESLVLEKNTLKKMVRGDYIVIDEFKGEELVGKEYEPLYKHKHDKKGYFIVNGGDDVLADEGTGVVHLALYGEFDYDMIKKYDLPVVQHVDKSGKIVHGPEEWIGKWFKKADKHVLEDLEKRNLLFSSADYTHSYPFCYRCDTPLFYNAVDSWFVDIHKVKKRLLEKNKEINWHPSHLKEGRFKHILETAPDWSISRNRFWATSIPVWKCECGEEKVIGSIKELRENATSKVPGDVDLHKHVVDKIKLKCKCGKEMERIPEVMDCWFESGSMPFAAKHYPFKNKEWFKDNYPADFVSEYVGQVRAWFYYMHVIGVLLFDKPPFKNVVVTGTMLASDGSKMSKSKKNFPDPMDIFEKYGADSLRFYLMSSNLMRAQDINFNEEALRTIHSKVIILAGNLKKFYELFCAENKGLKEPKAKNVIDKWLVSRTNKFIRNTTHAYEEYNTVQACVEASSFIEDISTWYVRRSRDRFKSKTGEDKEEAIQAFGYALLNLSKAIAPVTPFIAEDIYQSMNKNSATMKESVHLEDWPAFDETKIDEELEEKMGLTRRIVSMALDEREKAKIPVRQALAKLEVTGAKLEEEFLDLIKEELNVKKIVSRKERDLSVKLDTKITKDLLLEGIARDIIRKVNNYRKELNLTVKDYVEISYETTDKNVEESLKEHKDKIMKSVEAKKISKGIKNSGKEKKIKVNNADLHIEIKIVKK